MSQQDKKEHWSRRFWLCMLVATFPVWILGGYSVAHDIWVKQHTPPDFCKEIEHVKLEGRTLARSLELRGLSGDANEVRNDLNAVANLEQECEIDRK